MRKDKGERSTVYELVVFNKTLNRAKRIMLKNICLAYKLLVSQQKAYLGPDVACKP